MSRLLLLALMLIPLTASMAVGQTTRPVPPEWATAVSSFSSAMSSGNENAARELLSADVDIHMFALGADTTLRKLMDFASTATIIGSHAYVLPSSNIATDLATDIANSDAIPADAKRALATDSDGAKASETAGKWIAVSLRATDGGLVGMISLWNARPSQGGTAHPVFILLKGARDDAGKVVISKVVYGDPLN